MAEDLDERLEQIGFAGAIFADKDIDKIAAIKAQGTIPKVLVLADIERCQAHGISLYLGHHEVEQFCLFSSGGGAQFFQFIAAGHQLIDTGNDAVLFGSRRQPNNDFPYDSLADSWN